MKLILISWSFTNFNYSVGTLVADKYTVDQIFLGLKSVRLIKNMAIFRIKKSSSQLSRDIALLICVSYNDENWSWNVGYCLQ